MAMIEPDPRLRAVTTSDPLPRLLAGTYPDPDTGDLLGVSTRSLVISDSLAGDEGDLVVALGLGRRLAVISDPTTHMVLGERVEKALNGRFSIDSLVLHANPHPDDATVERLRSTSAHADALIAVGSGTINDLAKYASALDGK
ncbi:MAG: iron-containing alcohol dehydrogenase, partial [Devosia sp.]